MLTSRFRRTAWLLGAALSGGAGAAAFAAATAGPGVTQAPGHVESVEIPGTEVEFRMVYLPGGAFRMGSPPEEAGHEPDEGPVHEVVLEPFWMGAREVTHDEYAIFRYRRLDGPDIATAGEPFPADAVTRPSPPYEDPAHGMGKEGHPAVGMTRRAALLYARWLSAKTGRLFRLPTEAEWEFACRAGADSTYGWGDDPAHAREHAWTSESAESYREVGTLAPNGWGLYDLHGNVAEWVADEYRAGAYEARASGAPVTAPQEGRAAAGRGVVRGGSYLDGPAGVRCAERTPEDARWKLRDPQIPKSRWWNTDSPHVGFRLVSPARRLSRAEIEEFWRNLFGEPDTKP